MFFGISKWDYIKTLFKKYKITGNFHKTEDIDT